MIIRRHLLPAGLSAGAAGGLAELGTQIGSLGGKIFASGLRAGPSAILGAISGIFYSVIYDILPQRTGMQNLRNHAIAVIGSAVATYGLAFAAATAGLIAMPSVTFLSVMFVAAISTNAIFRAVFGGQHPRKAPAVQPQPPRPVSQGPQEPIGRPINPANRWIWPADLSKIGINAAVRDELDRYLEEIQADIGNGITPVFHRKNDHFAYNGKLWRLPRTLSFIEDSRTRKVSAILLSVSKDRVPILGKGKDRTAKIIYNLTTGERMCKKKAQSDYELELMKSLNGSKGIEPLSYVRKVKGKFFETKTQFITPLFKGSMHALLNENPALSTKDIKRMMLSLLNGLEKLHQHPGKGRFPNYFSYHSDIKPANLLYNKNAEGYDAVISDVETVNDTANLWGTLGWMSPGKVRYWNGAIVDVENYHKTHSQRDDIWSMGLVFASLLKNKMHEVRWGVHVAPLASIYGKCEAFPIGRRPFDSEVANIAQHELNQEINQIKADVALRPEGNAKEKMWDIVRGMLLVDSKRRSTAGQARAALEAVVV